MGRSFESVRMGVKDVSPRRHRVKKLLKKIIQDLILGFEKKMDAEHTKVQNSLLLFASFSHWIILGDLLYQDSLDSAIDEIYTTHL